MVDPEAADRLNCLVYHKQHLWAAVECITMRAIPRHPTMMRLNRLSASHDLPQIVSNILTNGVRHGAYIVSTNDVA